VHERQHPLGKRLQLVVVPLDLLGPHPQGGVAVLPHLRQRDLPSEKLLRVLPVVLVVVLVALVIVTVMLVAVVIVLVVIMLVVAHAGQFTGAQFRSGRNRAQAR